MAFGAVICLMGRFGVPGSALWIVLGFRIDFLCFTCNKISNTVFCVYAFVPYSPILRKFIFGGKVASESLSSVQGIWDMSVFIHRYRFLTGNLSEAGIMHWVCVHVHAAYPWWASWTHVLCVCHWCRFLMPSASSLVFGADSLVEAALSCLRPGV